MPWPKTKCVTFRRVARSIARDLAHFPQPRLHTLRKNRVAGRRDRSATGLELVGAIALTAPLARTARRAIARPTHTLPPLEAPRLELLREPFGRPRRVPWALVAISTMIVGSSLFATAPLTDASTGAPVSDGKLALPFLYKVFAPICDTLDTLSLFSERQHIAFIATCAVIYAVLRWRSRASGATGWRRLGKECILATLALLALVAVYAGGTMLPRPAARLAMSSPSAVVVDFHSHTAFSWDGRAEFTADANRRWHEQAGFDVAYITDHGTFRGAAAAARLNPARAGDSTVILSGIEVRSEGRHLDVLGTDARDSAAYESDDLNEDVFMRTVRGMNTPPPIVLMTLPGSLKPESGAVRIDALEISDGAPRALSQIDSQRSSLLDVARDRRLAVVAGSNNHGWARASPAWSVMEIAGWRSMTPNELDVAIRATILQRGYRAVRVVERRTAGPVSIVGTAMTAPLAMWRMSTGASWPERASWLAWIWIGYLAARLLTSIQRDTTLGRRYYV
jgi:hypothetical protein